MRPDQELFALGCCSLLGSCFQCFPNATSLSRTAVVAATDCHSAIHHLSNSLLLIFTVSFITPLLFYLPGAVLGAVVLFGVYSMVDFKELKSLIKIGKFRGGVSVLLST